MIRKLLIFVCAVFLSGTVFVSQSIHPQTVSAPEMEIPPTPITIPPEVILENKRQIQKVSEERLLAQIKDLIPEDATVGLTITNLKTKSTFGINTDLALPAASVNKVTTAAYLLNETYKNKISLDETIGWETIQNHLRDLLKASSNESWDVLGNFLGWENINNFARLLGTKKIDLLENVGSAEDFNILLSAILDNKIASSKLTSLFLGFMQDTETEDRIPAGLPVGTIVYHKSGSIDTSINDSAIILANENPFILTILTKDVPGGREEASSLIRKITRLVYASLNQ